MQTTGMDIFLKGEHSNMTGSFKERGEQRVGTRKRDRGKGGKGRGRETFPGQALRMAFK